MKRRLPRVSFAARIRASSSSGVASTKVAASGLWSRTIRYNDRRGRLVPTKSHRSGILDGVTVQRPPAGTIPDAPGSYQFKDRDGRIIYVGKAASLRQRLNNYFGDPKLMHPRTAQMVTAATSGEWV